MAKTVTIEVKDVWVIYCRTGCTCCSEDNHYRGMYPDEDSALRRKRRFETGPESPPVASQFAREDLGMATVDAEGRATGEHTWRL